MISVTKYRNKALDPYIKGQPYFQSFYGIHAWYNDDDMLHREDGPAHIINVNVYDIGLFSSSGSTPGENNKYTEKEFF